MNEPVGRTEHSQGSHRPGAYGSSAPPSSERGTDLPRRVATALRVLGIASSILQNLSVASSYDRRIDSSSAGVAEIADRLIAEAVAELNPPPGSTATEPSGTGALT